MSQSLPFLITPKNTVGLVGFVELDPLGFSDNCDIKCMKEAEIEHGRVAMLVMVGSVTAQFVSLPMCFLVKDSNRLQRRTLGGRDPMAKSDGRVESHPGGTFRGRANGYQSPVDCCFYQFSVPLLRPSPRRATTISSFLCCSGISFSCCIAYISVHCLHPPSRSLCIIIFSLQNDISTLDFLAYESSSYYLAGIFSSNCIANVFSLRCSTSMFAKLHDYAS